MRINQDKVIACRSQWDWTQQQLADACGVSLRTIQRVERDGIGSKDTVQALCAVCQLAREELVEDADNSVRSEPYTEQTNHTQRPTWLDALPLLVTLVVGMFIGVALILFITQR